MLKYSKIINEETKQVQVGTGNNTDFYKSLGFELLDVEKGEGNNWYVKGNVPVKTLEEVKDEVIKVLWLNCKTYIYSVYNQETQLNMGHGLYTEEERQTMITFIQENRNKYHTIKENIENCQTIEEVYDIDITFKGDLNV